MSELGICYLSERRNFFADYLVRTKVKTEGKGAFKFRRIDPQTSITYIYDDKYGSEFPLSVERHSPVLPNITIIRRCLMRVTKMSDERMKFRIFG